MTPEEFTLADAVITQTAKFYARRSFSLPELRQEGWLATLAALRRTKEPPTSFKAFVRCVATRELSRFCWTFSSPVHHPKPSAKTVGQYETAPFMEGTMQLETHEITPFTAAAYDLMVAREQLRNRLNEIHDAHTAAVATPAEIVKAATSVLLDGAQVQRDYGHLPVKEIYRAQQRIMKYAIGDAATRTLVERIAENRRCLHG